MRKSLYVVPVEYRHPAAPCDVWEPGRVTIGDTAPDLIEREVTW